MRPRLLMATTLLATALVGCGEAADSAATDSPTVDTARAASGVADSASAAAPAGTAEPGCGLQVWFSSGEELVAVGRPDAGAGAADPVRAALDALVAGPTAGERDRGLSSWFGTETRGLVREVRRDSGRLMVSFERSLASAIPGAASSAGSEALLSALDSTVFQFEDVQAVEYRLGESCAAFWEWLQRECHVVRR